MQEIVDDERLERVELKVALKSAGGNGGVVANDLAAHHGQGLALRGVDFARHDAAARLVGRQAVG